MTANLMGQRRARYATRFALPLAWLVLAGCVALHGDPRAASLSPVGVGQSDTYYVVAHPGFTPSLSAACMAFAAAYAAMSLGRVKVRQHLGWTQLVLSLVGGLMLFYPLLWTLTRTAPQRYEDLPPAFAGANRVSTAGCFLVAMSLLVFFVATSDWLVRGSGQSQDAVHSADRL